MLYIESCIVMQSREWCFGMVNDDMEYNVNAHRSDLFSLDGVQAGPQRGVGGEQKDIVFISTWKEKENKGERGEKRKRFFEQRLVGPPRITKEFSSYPKL